MTLDFSLNSGNVVKKEHGCKINCNQSKVNRLGVGGEKGNSKCSRMWTKKSWCPSLNYFQLVFIIVKYYYAAREMSMKPKMTIVNIMYSRLKAIQIFQNAIMKVASHKQK